MSNEGYLCQNIGLMSSSKELTKELNLSRTHIALTGLTGSGKSTVGSKLSKYLRRKFIDLDSYIERSENTSINEIFSKHGEEHFRELEKKYMKEIFLSSTPVVLSLGGGAAIDQNSRAYIKANAYLICLEPDIDEVAQRIIGKGNRPLIDSAEDPLAKLKSIKESRADAYADSDLQLSTSGKNIQEVLEEIIECVGLTKIKQNYLDLNIPGKTHKYNIIIDSISRLDLKGLRIGNNILIVSQEGIPIEYTQELKQKLQTKYRVKKITLPNGEKHKNFFSYQLIVQKLLNKKFERNDTILALGGGVVGDMAGFAAATYLRGINFIQIPTTLLSMVDSSVGGKTGFNVPEGKNLIGAFYQPKLVHIDTKYLTSLSPSEYKCGLGEIIKYALLGWQWDDVFKTNYAVTENTFFEFLNNNSKEILARDNSILKIIIHHCLNIKAGIVVNDERESGLRAHLNLGHTFGHAFEEITNYSMYSHGEAVAIGIICAFYLSEEIGLITNEKTEAVIKLLRNFNMQYKVPKSIDPITATNYMQYDKKVENGKIKFVLPKDKLGQVNIIRDVELHQIHKAIKRNQV